MQFARCFWFTNANGVGSKIVKNFVECILYVLNVKWNQKTLSNVGNMFKYSAESVSNKECQELLTVLSNTILAAIFDASLMLFLTRFCIGYINQCCNRDGRFGMVFVTIMSVLIICFTSKVKEITNSGIYITMNLNM